MSLRDWLPITTRNRLALGLAGLALVVLVTWNCLPYYEYRETSSDKIVMMIVWGETLSPDNYIGALRSPDVDGFLEVAAYLALLQSAVVTVVAVPFWKLLHSSAYIRLPLAVLNVMGGSVVLWHLFDSGLEDRTPLWIETLVLIALGMLTISASLFTFRNELALRSERMFAQAVGS